MGKWPIISVDGSGTILQVELRDSFKERPGLEMHPGILLPGFVDLCEINFGDEEVLPNFNLHFAHGTILLGSSCLHQKTLFPRLTLPEVKDENSPAFLLRDKKNDLSLFHRMKEHHQSFPQEELPELLLWATQWGGDKTSIGAQFGQLKEGFRPGVLVLQKIDLNSMQLTFNAQVKWLSVPKYD